jgi:hypothetical protein
LPSRILRYLKETTEFLRYLKVEKYEEAFFAGFLVDFK